MEFARDNLLFAHNNTFIGSFQLGTRNRINVLHVLVLIAISKRASLIFFSGSYNLGIKGLQG